MGLLVVNSDFEKLWGEPYPSISFDNATYSLAGEVGTELSAAFSITDNNDADVTEQCEIAFSNDYVRVEEGQFVCDDLEVGTYATEVTATYSYKSATVTATATINISVEEEQPTSISFDSASYSISGNEHAALSAQFNVEDNLGNDITSLCAYSFSPNDKGVYSDGGYFKVDSAVAGTYDITVTATYGQLTATATIAMTVVDYPDSISFDSASYSMSGSEGDTITQAFTVTDDLSNDVTASCSYAFLPNDTGITASNGAFDASSVLAGTYSVTVTATYASGNGSTLTATATISMDIAAAGPQNQYFATEALENGTVFTYSIPANIDTTEMTSLSYSMDNGETWTTIANTSSTVYGQLTAVNSGDKVLWKGIGTALSDNTNVATGSSHIGVYNNKRFNVSGNIMSLLYGDDFRDKTAFASGSSFNFAGFFYQVSKLVSAENLVLPATTMANSCYQAMFNGCTSLTTAPALPATTLASSCYQQMFQSCTSLTTAPELPATTLAADCYSQMFDSTNVLPDCTHIDFTSSTVVASGGLRGLFYGTKVTYSDLSSILPKDGNNKPCLPVATLGNYCYQFMFEYCTSLTTAPELPATTLGNYCYQCMFQGCTSLTTAPTTLPATTLKNGCYKAMFNGCTSLTTVPSNLLPATTLTQECYTTMFKGCTSLTTAPELPALTLMTNQFNDGMSGSYDEMFMNCTSLNSVKALFTNNKGYLRMLENVAATGTFVKNPSASWTAGTEPVPSGWTVVDAQ